MPRVPSLPSFANRPPAPSGADQRRREHGQALVIFTIALVAMVSVAGLLVDGGMAWANRRQAQASADTAALAAAKTFGSTSDESDATDAAKAIATENGFPDSYTDCSGNKKNDGVTVHMPPVSGPNTGSDGYVEVIVQRSMRTSFSGLVGQPCWMVSARAVAVTTSTEVASCNFCSLNNSTSNHTLLLKNGATLRVDGDIHANSRNGGVTPGVCEVKMWKVCGDGFDIFGDGGSISAKHITVVGGWETHDDNIATADELAPGCTESYTPTGQAQTSNVCVHMPEIPDPLNDPAKPGARVNPPTPGAPAVPGSNGCPGTAVVPSGTISVASQTRITTGNKTVCPGTYYGGLQISGGNVTMLPGVYIMVGGGFQILNKADVDGSAGVMIYATGSAGGSNSTSQGTSLVPDAVPGKINISKVGLTSSAKSINPGDSVTFTFEFEFAGKSAPVPGGYVDFYDGNVMLCGASPVIRDSPTSKGFTSTCSTSYAIWGVRSIAGVYSGDATYNAAGDAVTLTVKAPSGVKDGPITIDTTGRVDLHGPASGPYAGMTLFQDRTSSSTITLAPGRSSTGGCPGWFMTRGVPPDTSAPPDPCGAIGGLQGTVYAAHQNALVLIEASGMANLQVIAGEIQVTSDANARFGFKPSVFANSSIHLVE